MEAQARVDPPTTNAYTALHSAAEHGYTGVMQLLLDAGADPNVTDEWNKTPIYRAAEGGHTQAIQLLLASPQMAPAAMAGAARAAQAAGHAELAIMLFNALRSRDRALAAAELALCPTLIPEVLMQLQAAEDSVSEHEARWPALQQLVVGMATTHQELRAAAADITASAVSAAMQAAMPLSSEAADATAVEAAASASAVAAVANVAPLAQDAAVAAAATAAAIARLHL